MNSIISLKNITKFYQNGNVKNTVLNNFSVEFFHNCFSIIAGPSGSGKSTLLNILATLDIPGSGEYYFKNQLLDFRNKKELVNVRKKHFGFVFQSFNLIPVLTSIENVELPLTLSNFKYNERRKKAEEALILVGLKDKLNSRPGQLSGGEQQRVAIARAIVGNPEIVFADEPTANLDRENAVKIINLMEELNNLQLTNFIIASHDDKVIKKGKEIIWIENQ
ncbi:MAG: ABC transporter ATP-binding protein [Dysgonamonadaceae bacterium]|jgi:putative ABC transport system ATP-binding protein|nr:ABC transporter ATP-binding protein [Dysgonamonadaceae bacterium]